MLIEVGEAVLGFFTVQEVAAKLNCSGKTVYRLIWAYDRGDPGGLEAVTVGARSRRVTPEALKDYQDRLVAAARGQSGQHAAQRHADERKQPAA